MSPDRARDLAFRPELADYFEAALTAAGDEDGADPVSIANWIPQLVERIGSDADPAQSQVSPDPGDPKLAHLDGLNLSRAWMLRGIASGLQKGDKRLPIIIAAAEKHERAGLAAVTGEHYEGGHWLGSFAVYLVTRRGTPQ